VYGDIGTSPLYSVRAAFTGHGHELELVKTNIYGVCSLAFWALVVIISIKYLLFVMRADNHGEGGILALTALVLPRDGARKVRNAGALVALGVFGTALLYGDGVITPAISVLSAVEGLQYVDGLESSIEPWVVPIACVILIALFAVQYKGTEKIGRVFGPIMVVWFSVLAVMGLVNLVDAPSILGSMNPLYAAEYFANEPLKGFLSLGAIFLVVTGGEALYADMGHFGRRPIMLGWYSLVLPGLLLNYWGQGAYLLENENFFDAHFADPEAVGAPSIFFNMAPEGVRLPLVILATMATIIASQALISGVYSLTAQAVQLDYLPRLEIRHTSREHAGQIYVPLVNWLLMIACVGLVIVFQKGENLEAAYGIAVTMTMAITTLIFFRVATDRWGWSQVRAFAICIPLFVVELAFLGANLVKIPEGGWFALAVGIGLMVQMATWRRGRQLVAARIKRGERPIVEVLDEAGHLPKVSGSAVFMFKDPGMAPPAFVNNVRHNKVIHKDTLLVSVQTADSPRVPVEERVEVTRIEPGVHQVVLTYGFMEEPDVPADLCTVNFRGLHFDPDEATYFLGHETVLHGKAPGMNPLAERLFVLLNRGADSAGRFFNLPPERVFEVGSHVEI
jgi:KUP system potassium uptake protein